MNRHVSNPANRTNRLSDELDAAQQHELGDLSNLVEQLSAYDISEPDSAALMTQLTPLLRQPLHVRVRQWFSLAWAQIALLEPSFLTASLLLFGFGAVLSILDGRSLAEWFILLSPVLAAGGVGYVFRPSTQGLRELERISPVQPAELLFARLLIILSFNSILSLGLILISWGDVPFALWRMLLVWFGPMLGLSGLALILSVRVNAVFGSVAAMGVWCILIFVGWREIAVTSTPTLNLMPLVASNGYLIGSLASLAVGLVLITYSCWWVNRTEAL
jgi:hypothetical protein